MKTGSLLLFFAMVLSLYSGEIAERHSYYSIEEAYACRDIATDLLLNNATIVAFPPEVFALTNLVNLSISSASFRHLSPDIGKLNKLRWLSIKNHCIINATNCLRSIPSEIGCLTNLVSLSITGHRTLASLPEEIGNLMELKDLALWQNGLSRLPASIGNLAKLEALYLRNNNLQAIPSEIGQLKSLKQLSLSDNMLTDLPEELFDLENLEELDVEHNYLARLSPGIAKLEKLNSLNLFQNKINSFPDEIQNLKQLRNMTVGYLSKEEGERLKRLLPNCKITVFEIRIW
jgi:Leucine-rich repeat (LRR) protein